MGLSRDEAINWAWMLAGLLGSKKFGLASFCIPAKRKVTPRKSRSGSSAHPARAQALGGGDSSEGEVVAEGASADLVMPQWCHMSAIDSPTRPVRMWR